MIAPRQIRHVIAAWSAWISRRRMRKVLPELADAAERRELARRQHRNAAAIERHMRNMMIAALRGQRI